MCRRHPDKWRKEVHFFDQWPLGPSTEYINCFPKKRRVAALAGASRAVFLDASPEYLFTPAAAPRVQKILPNAKFVIVLRVRLGPHLPTPFTASCRRAHSPMPQPAASHACGAARREATCCWRCGQSVLTDMCACGREG